MGPLSAVLFEPVGCLAEFQSEPFLEIASRLFGRRRQVSRSASRAYWHLLNLMEDSGSDSIESLEVEAVTGAALYPDVLPALEALKEMGIRRYMASSLSQAAISRFLASCPHDFDAVWTRDNSPGIKAAPLRRALEHAAIEPRQAMFLTDTVEGLKVAESIAINSVLMMNDPDESRRLAMLNPAGGIVSLHELPDFLRLLRANARSSQRF